MAEASHDDIMRRVAAVERTQEAMQGQIVQIGEQAKAEAQDNRIAMDDRIDEIRSILSTHREEFSAFRGEVRGAAMVVKWGLPLGMTALLAVVGWALA